MPYADPVERKAYMDAYNEKRRVLNPDAPNNKAKAWNKNNPERKQMVRYFINAKILYGISAVKYLSTLLYQGYKCACCRRSNWGDKTIKRPCIDHDHDTLQFRGLICHWCNRQIGHLGDNAKNVRRRTKEILNYLERAP